MGTTCSSHTGKQRMHLVCDLSRMAKQPLWLLSHKTCWDKQDSSVARRSAVALYLWSLLSDKELGPQACGWFGGGLFIYFSWLLLGRDWLLASLFFLTASIAPGLFKVGLLFKVCDYVRLPLNPLNKQERKATHLPSLSDNPDMLCGSVSKKPRVMGS